eukprot:TRINITY_DN50007_c0_g1_i1.p1 TRINITY_DN50007_c0_g1~~TRINITY_DN50007_c0_g1_i1.p1  ORF type:complete len:534 (+),score=83.98 TRINITY_DN50007_c0_g1_i1:159-1604(+)
MAEKTELLSILLPPQETWSELDQLIHDQAKARIPDHIYIDDGSLEAHRAAFLKYRFSLISNDLGSRHVSQAFVRSVGFHCIAVYNGFVEVGAMVFNGIADFIAEPFNLDETVTTIKKHNEQLGALWHYQRIIQDQFQYRYNRPFEEKLLSQACTLCRVHAMPRIAQLPPAKLVFVGIYSARRNFAKRAAVRETWGRLLTEKYGFRYIFFLGEASDGASQDEVRMRREVEQYGDIVFLDAKEGYRKNSQKGLLFLQWVALHADAEFLLKVDDDVYFRPAPLLNLLLRKPATQYAWGYFDYISPVPRVEGDYFHNTEETYPFEVFAPYPRGVVRVLSMDVVRQLSKAGHEGKLRLVFGDDPCIGVHLRQLLFDEEEPMPSLTLDDFDNKVFAMEPSCHPDLWSKITNRTWAVHHVTPEQIRCMWNADLNAGYLLETPDGISYNEEVAIDGLPDLCSCASEDSFLNRTDVTSLQEETDELLFGD